MAKTYTKTAKDIQLEQQDLLENEAIRYLKNPEAFRFNLGDVLNREDKWGDKWNVDTADCGVRYKYIYAWENEVGIGYIRKMSVDGRKFSGQAVPVTKFDPRNTRFVLDPLYADHLLMGDDEADFDAKSEYKVIKKKRDIMNKYNDGIREKTETEADALALFNRLVPGDQIWYGWTRLSVDKEPWVVQSVNFNKMYPDQSYVELVRPNIANTYARGPYQWRARDLKRYFVFTQKPKFIDEIL